MVETSLILGEVIRPTGFLPINLQHNANPRVTIKDTVANTPFAETKKPSHANLNAEYQPRKHRSQSIHHDHQQPDTRSDTVGEKVYQGHFKRRDPHNANRNQKLY
jgi:hypothetical protein